MGWSWSQQHHWQIQLTVQSNLIVGCGLPHCGAKNSQNVPNVSYSDAQIMAVVSVVFLASFAISMFYRYAAVPWFNSLDNKTYKFIVATLSPVLALLPTTVCRHMALWRSSEIIDPQRSFVLVYNMRAASITLYRIMQADFQSLRLFIGLLFFSGFSYVVRTATLNFRNKLWARVVELLRKTCAR